MYLPSTDAEPTLGTVVLGIDTSGSISNSMLQYFASHLNSILDTCKPEKVYVVYCDSAVDHVDEFTAEDLPVHLEMHGGGGTDMREVVAWAEENVDDPSVCIIFTDMYTPFPDSEPAFPLLWASVTEGYKSPVGETIYVDSSAD
jgi:predicted metal-dependent peptidase